MLIQIINRRNELCPHCLQYSVPEGEHMQDTTFKKVLNFLRVFPVPAVVISGGEPTEHPKFLQYCTASTSLKHCAEQLSAQVRRTSMGLTNASMLCKPCVDYQGKIHMSESRLCPACGDLNTDTYIEIWDKMKNFTPCGRCKNLKRFESSTRTDIITAKNIIYGNKQQD